MNKQKFSFSVSSASSLIPESYTKAGKKYLAFKFFYEQREVFNFLDKTLNGVLMVPEDNSTLIQQLKAAQKSDIFTTSLQNLRLEQDFAIYDDEALNGLFIKDAKQVKKINETETPFAAFTFKVLQVSTELKSSKPGGEDYKPGNDILILKTEPFSLGIEGMPDITRIVFEFSFPAEPGHLNRKKYEELFLNSEGKEFTMKVKTMKIGHPKGITIGEKIAYETLSFSEEQSIEEIKSSLKSEKRNNGLSDTNSDSLKIVLIGGGIIIGLILIAFASYLFMKKKRSLKK